LEDDGEKEDWMVVEEEKQSRPMIEMKPSLPISPFAQPLSDEKPTEA
jgi:hypothetical protein